MNPHNKRIRIICEFALHASTYFARIRIICGLICYRVLPGVTGFVTPETRIFTGMLPGYRVFPI